MASEHADENVNPGTGGPAGAGADQDTQGTQSPGASADRTLDPKVAATVAAAEAAGPAGGETVRIDSWIWAVRLIKTRSLGAAACRGGHVHVNGERVKPAYSLRVGDEVRLRHEGRERIVIVKRLIRKRVGAPVATQCYVDNSPPPPPREAAAPVGLRDRGTGRPTKRDRRELERLRVLGGPGALGGFGASGGAGGQSGFAGLGGPGGAGGAGAGGRDASGGRGRTGGHSGSDGRGGTARRGGSASDGTAGRPRGR
ncbi:RNA-binding S4 domain-containing protein [Streptomyces sp. NPDC052109]|uniref:RNA-binding S4 domain-containing protein n=1 Tax=Streptomyces sp. NPDC052109 TaxID=3155527 RepID=UPI003442EDAA